MNDPIIQAIMQMLAAQNPNSNMGGLGTGGFDPDPASNIAQQNQVGQSLQFPSELSPTGMNPNFMQTANMMQGMGGQPNMGAGQALQGGASSTGAIRSNQPHSAALKPFSPQDLYNAVGTA